MPVGCYELKMYDTWGDGLVSEIDDYYYYDLDDDFLDYYFYDDFFLDDPYYNDDDPYYNDDGNYYIDDSFSFENGYYEVFLYGDQFIFEGGGSILFNENSHDFCGIDKCSTDDTTVDTITAGISMLVDTLILLLNAILVFLESLLGF